MLKKILICCPIVIGQFCYADDPIKLLQLGKQAELQGDITLAIKQYQNILAVNSKAKFAKFLLAKALLLDHQDNASKEIFKQLLEQSNEQEKKILKPYLNALQNREKWQFDFGLNYISDKNINNASSQKEIENTGFIKSDEMLPQKANGFGYSLSIIKQKNLNKSHYVHFANDFSGKVFFNNSKFNEINNRLTLGYGFQNYKHSIFIKPFFELQFDNITPYAYATGLRTEYKKTLNKKLELSSSFEYSNTNYFKNFSKNSHTFLLSSTLIYKNRYLQHFFIGTDFTYNNAQKRANSYHSEKLRLGWIAPWQFGFKTNLTLSLAQKKYKDKALLGDFFHLSNIRKDNIFDVNFAIPNNHLQFYHIMPVLHFNWRKQKSTIDSLYSYTKKSIFISFERAF